MECCMLLRLADVMSLILILSGPFKIQGRERDFVKTNKKTKTTPVMFNSVQII